MPDYLTEVLARYRRDGILIDTNLLLLYLVGLHDESMIARFKRTRSYTVSEFRLLQAYASQFDRVVTTPNILTEASNLSEKHPPGEKMPFFGALASRIATLDESFLPSSEVARTTAFPKLGLSDAVIVRLATQRKMLVLTDDLELYAFLVNTGVDAINFNHIRTLAWPL